MKEVIWTSELAQQAGGKKSYTASKTAQGLQIMTPCDHACKGQSGKNAQGQVSVWRSSPASHPQDEKIRRFQRTKD
jgi:hypothetical protein